MSEVSNRERWTAETMEWAEVQGKHAEMHFLRWHALHTTQLLVEQIGIHPQLSQEMLNVFPARGSLRSEARLFIGAGVKVSNLIPLCKHEEPDHRGLEYEFAAVKENYRFTHVELQPRIRRLHLPGRSAPNDEPEVRESAYYADFRIARFAGDLALNPRQTLKLPGLDVAMMSHPGLDVRSMQLWSPDEMIDRYQGQIDQLAVYMDALASLSEAADHYPWTDHISQFVRKTSS